MLGIVLDNDYFFDTGFKARKDEDFVEGLEKLCYCPLCNNVTDTYEFVSIGLLRNSHLVQRKREWAETFKCSVKASKEEFLFTLTCEELLKHLKKHNEEILGNAIIKYLEKLYGRIEINNDMEDTTMKDSIESQVIVTSKNKEKKPSNEDQLDIIVKEKIVPKLSTKKFNLAEKFAKRVNPSKTFHPIQRHEPIFTTESELDALERNRVYDVIDKNVVLEERRKSMWLIYEQCKLSLDTFLIIINMMNEDFIDEKKARSLKDWEDIAKSPNNLTFMNTVKSFKLPFSEYPTYYYENSKALDYRNAYNKAREVIVNGCKGDDLIYLENEDLYEEGFESGDDDDEVYENMGYIDYENYNDAKDENGKLIRGDKPFLTRRQLNDLKRKDKRIEIKCQKLAEFKELIKSDKFFDFPLQEEYFMKKKQSTQSSRRKGIYACPCNPEFMHEMKYLKKKSRCLKKMNDLNSMICHLEQYDCVIHKACGMYLRTLFQDVLFKEKMVRTEQLYFLGLMKSVDYFSVIR